MTALRKARRWDSTYALGLIALGLVPPILIAMAAGALDIPQNDDHAYRRAALSLYETGQIELGGWVATTLVGQLALVQPLLMLSRGQPWAFAVVAVIAACVAIAAGYCLARRVLSARCAAMAVGTLIVFPGFWLTATSFMTDIPALGAELTCLALGAVALSRNGRAGRRWLIASLVAGCVAFSIRDFALAAPVAVLVATAASGKDSSRFYLVAGAVSVIVVALIHFYAAQLPGHWPGVMSQSAGAFRRLAQGFATLSLGLSPILVVAAATWRHHLHPRDLLVGALGSAVVFAGPLLSIIQTGRFPRFLVGNLLEPSGALGQVVSAGVRPVLFPRPLWELLNIASLVAGIGLCILAIGIVGSLWRSRRYVQGSFLRLVGSTHGMLAVFVLTYGVGIALYSMWAWMFDRYLWPLVVPIAVLLLTKPTMLGWSYPTDIASRQGRPMALVTRALALGLFAVIGSTSLVLTLNAAAFNSARWRLGEQAARRGIPAESIDAGIEWVGTYAPGRAYPDTPVGAHAGTWYDNMYPSFRLCAIASSSLIHLPAFRLETADTRAYRLLLFVGNESPLFLYRVVGPGCPPA